MAKNKINKYDKSKVQNRAKNRLSHEEETEQVGKLKLTGIGKKFKKLSQNPTLKRITRKDFQSPKTEKTWEEKRNLVKKTQKLKKFVVAPLARCLMPLVLLAGLLIIRFADIPERALDSTGVKSLEAPNFPISIVFDKKQDSLGTTWIKTPGGVCHIEDTDDLNLASEEIKYMKADTDGKMDMLWRLDFTNQEGIGITLWIAALTESSKIYICKTPIVPSRWHALPMKLNLPEKYFLYFSPTTPLYQDVPRQYIGREAYTFPYTITLTQDGPTFVPAPHLYKEILPIFTEILRHEPITEKHAAYKKMETDMFRIAGGLPISIACFKNIRMETVDIMTWKN